MPQRGIRWPLTRLRPSFDAAPRLHHSGRQRGPGSRPVARSGGPSHRHPFKVAGFGGCSPRFQRDQERAAHDRETERATLIDLGIISRRTAPPWRLPLAFSAPARTPDSVSARAKEWRPTRKRRRIVRHPVAADNYTVGRRGALRYAVQQTGTFFQPRSAVVQLQAREQPADSRLRPSIATGGARVVDDFALSFTPFGAVTKPAWRGSPLGRLRVRADGHLGLLHPACSSTGSFLAGLAFLIAMAKTGRAGACSMTSAPGAGESEHGREKRTGDGVGWPELAQGARCIAVHSRTWRSSPCQGSERPRGQPSRGCLASTLARQFGQANGDHLCTMGELPASRVVGAERHRPHQERRRGRRCRAAHGASGGPAMPWRCNFAG